MNIDKYKEVMSAKDFLPDTFDHLIGHSIVDIKEINSSESICP